MIIKKICHAVEDEVSLPRVGGYRRPISIKQTSRNIFLFLHPSPISNNNSGVVTVTVTVDTNRIRGGCSCRGKLARTEW